MHPAQCQITDRSHSEMLLAGGAQGSFRRADRGAYFREIDRSARVRLEIFLEMRDDRFVTSAARSRVVSVASGETANQNAKKRIVDRSKNFRRRQDVGRLLRQQADHPVQRQQTRHHRLWRTKNAPAPLLLDVAAGQRFDGRIQFGDRHRDCAVAMDERKSSAVSAC